MSPRRAQPVVYKFTVDPELLVDNDQAADGHLRCKVSCPSCGAVRIWWLRPGTWRAECGHVGPWKVRATSPAPPALVGAR